MQTPQQKTEQLYIQSVANYKSDKSDLFYYNQAISIEMVLRVAFGMTTEQIKNLLNN